MRKKLFHRSLLLAAMIVAFTGTSSAALIFSINFAPPPLPVYEQPLCPGEGYIWTPGYWAYSDDGFFWVPGTWVLPPDQGLLWTPGYWGWANGAYIFNQGYWAPQVGFYGGIYYGFGYTGIGYEGGYWDHDRFFYNRSVNNVTNITNVYNKTVIHNVNVTRVSYNGGAGGVAARPTAQEQAIQHERHVAPSAVQTRHIQEASTNRRLFESANHGKPPIAATPKPNVFSGHGVVKAKAAARNYQPAPARRSAAVARSNQPNPAVRANERTPNERAPMARNNEAPRPLNSVHAKELPPLNRPNAANEGNTKQARKFEQQQQSLYSRQQKERQQLEQRQQREDQRYQSRPNPPRQQQTEQRHQQQTQQMYQRHETQRQQLQTRQPRMEARPPEQKPRR